MPHGGTAAMFKWTRRPIDLPGALLDRSVNTALLLGAFLAIVAHDIVA